MVKYSSVANTFGALSDPTRCAVIERLSREREAPVTVLAAGHDISLPAFLKHVRVLESAGLLRTEKVGRERRCSLIMGRLEEAERWIHDHRSFWSGQLESLDRYLRERQNTEPIP